MCAFFSVRGFVRKMFHSDQYLCQAAFEMGEETHVGLPVHNCYWRPIWTNILICCHMFAHLPSIKFNENSFGSSRAASWLKTDTAKSTETFLQHFSLISLFLLSWNWARLSTMKQQMWEQTPWLVLQFYLISLYYSFCPFLSFFLFALAFRSTSTCFVSVLLCWNTNTVAFPSQIELAQGSYVKTN